MPYSHPFSPSQKIILLFIALSFTMPVKGQGYLNDVVTAFNQISLTPSKVIHLHPGPFKIPSGGHLQGIQALSDSEVIITASSGSYSYYITGNINTYKLTGLQKIMDTPFRHAGGCQLINNRLFVGVEDNMAKNKSHLMAITFNDSLHETAKSIIAERRGIVKRSTAGATGVTKTHTGQFIVAVGDWDTKNIDFYISKSGADSLFDSLTTYTVPSEQTWYSYQSINLITDSTNNIYLVAFALDGTNNRADLYKVAAQKEAAKLILLTSRNFKCKSGAGFRYGAGINISNQQLSIYSCSRGAKPKLAINIFKPSRQ